MNGKWRKVYSTSYIERHRTGWWGVWDALKAAWKREDRLVVKQPVTLSLWVKVEPEREVQARITQTQLNWDEKEAH
jgi:hypothetical protein